MEGETVRISYFLIQHLFFIFCFIFLHLICSMFLFYDEYWESYTICSMFFDYVIPEKVTRFAQSFLLWFLRKLHDLLNVFFLWFLKKLHDLLNVFCWVFPIKLHDLLNVFYYESWESYTICSRVFFTLIP